MTTWRWLGIGLLALAVGWYVWVFWWTRTRRIRSSHAAGDPTMTSDPALRRLYLSRIDDLERDSAAGRVGTRLLHQRLSLLLREFVHELTTRRAHTMTLSELRAAGLGPLSDVIELYYPAEFMQAEHGDRALALARAREVVATWS